MDPGAKGELRETHFLGYDIEMLDKKKSEAHVGYMRMNLYEPPKEATWGIFNDRVINDAWVKDLVRDFKRRMEHCTNEDALDVAIRPEWLENRGDMMSDVNGKGILNVPEMEFTEDGRRAISPDNLIMLGGNHRRAAVKIYVEELKERHDAMEKSVKEKKKKHEAEGKGYAHEDWERIKVLEGRVKGMKERLEESKHWTVRIYDRGAPDG